MHFWVFFKVKVQNGVFFLVFFFFFLGGGGC